MSRPTIFAQLDALTELGILNEMTGQRRNRLWVYERYYELLGEGAKPL
jgi:cell filamentation protein, protein adenylyltransferase